MLYTACVFILKLAQVPGVARAKINVEFKISYRKKIRILKKIILY